ncbi:hypothetical protein OHB41_49865 [Streptomyces sp. NBC_01571]|uniref:hypothetical protein n=1 Tax=Streptomyces sp. NBC_01571 TaxID=2975883 RepID=UPI002259BDAB|nr:hypothetical protein [Streptomyces sp. NBC_01571]MCX4581071.1 hypothetical protein [Streptomyces sp. NBC_01571]
MTSLVRYQLARAREALARYRALVTSQPSDRGASAMEWALIMVAGGTLVGVVAAAANTTVGEKALQIIGF